MRRAGFRLFLNDWSDQLQARLDVQVPPGGLTSYGTKVSAGCDHGCIVGAENGTGNEDRHPRPSHHGLAKLGIGGYPSGEEYLFHIVSTGGVNGFSDQHVDHRLLETGGYLGSKMIG